jgi:hypothetical protein
MTRTGNSISLWNRAIEYDANLFFPKRIISGGGDVLARPVELRIDGKAVTGKNDIVSFKETRLERSARGSAAGLDIALSSYLEYDGMEWYEFTLSPKGKGAEVKDLRLVLPLERDVAELYYKNIRDAGSFQKMPKKAPFPYYMLMVRNDARGLIWFTESQEGYNLERQDECITWEESEDAVELTIHFIDHPFSITDERRISFGLTPTPIRPDWTGWRRMRIGKLNAPHEAHPPLANWQFWWTWAGRRNPDNPADAASETHVRYRNVLEAPYDDLRKRYAEWKEAGITPLPYFMATGVNPFIPEYKYYMEEWRIDPYPRPDIEAEPDPNAHTRVCSYSTFHDFFFHLLKPGIAGTLFQGSHVDLAGPLHCKNEYHGCGYVDDEGKRQARFTYLGSREFFRRFNTILQEVHGDKRPTLLEGHPNPNLFPCGFLDAVATGENYVAEVGRHGDYHWFDLDQFRAVCAPHSGIMSILLTQFARARPAERDLWFTEEKKPIVEHLCGLVLAHDATVWPAYSINIPYQEMWKAQDAFGWDDSVECLPYWNNAEYISVENGDKNLVVTLYKRPGGLMVVILNHTDKELAPTIRFNLEKLGVHELAGGPVYDPIGDRMYHLDWYSLTVPMKKWSYKMLIYKSDVRAAMRNHW